MRITGGIARGIPLKVGQGEGLRPATDRMREAVFSSLGPAVEDAHVLDLFAGSGAYGLEAVSRGAAFCYWVERHRRTSSMLKANVAAVARSLQRMVTEIGVVVEGDALGFQGADRIDLVFVDPPYALWRDRPDAVLQALERMLEGHDPQVVMEAPGETDLRWPGWELRRQLGKGRDQPNAFIWERAL
ncbi:MAG: 16S rRNA (guanine966-N2)-methyltransferase [Puniceicoccaceae bacterium 5H]|nr:MAG: 16S rRNA (guanine966-N2)-methyltransferase [Puniceicoccaceae bacterium 5H]